MESLRKMPYKYPAGEWEHRQSDSEEPLVAIVAGKLKPPTLHRNGPIIETAVPLGIVGAVIGMFGGIGYAILGLTIGAGFGAFAGKVYIKMKERPIPVPQCNRVLKEIPVGWGVLRLEHIMGSEEPFWHYFEWETWWNVGVKYVGRGHHLTSYGEWCYNDGM